MRKVTVTLEVEIPRGPYCHEFATDTTCRRFDDGEKYEPSGMFEHEDRCELFDIKLVRLEDPEWRYPYPHKVYRCTKCLALDKKKLIRNKSTKRSRAFWESVKRSAKSVEKCPEWMKAGITLNPEHYETYPPKERK